MGVNASSLSNIIDIFSVLSLLLFLTVLPFECRSRIEGISKLIGLEECS